MNAKPLISIVTPTRNQVHTLSGCMDSVLLQEGVGELFDLQYIVVDGGSTDGSLSLIEARRDQLHWYQSGDDDGPYDAVNQGLHQADGDILGWLNGDDALCPWALRTIAGVFASITDCRWLTTRNPILMDAGGQIAMVHHRPGFSSEAILRGAHHPCSFESLPYLQQESTFFHQELWTRVGRRIDTEYALAGDFDLWLRMAEFSELDSVAVPLGMFRSIEGQRSSDQDRYRIEAARSLQERRGIVMPEERPAIGWASRAQRRITGRSLWSDECPLIERENPGSTEAAWIRRRRSIGDRDWS